MKAGSLHQDWQQGAGGKFFAHGIERAHFRNQGQAGDNPVSEINSNIAHHDGCGYLIHPFVCPQIAWNYSPDRGECGSAEETEQDMKNGRQTQFQNTCQGSTDGSQVHITFHADIPDTGLDSKGNPDTAKQKRRRADKDIAQGLTIAKGSSYEGAVSNKWVNA